MMPVLGMSLVRRIKRYLQAERLPQLAMVDRVGIDGEQYADQFLAPPLVVSRIANPVLPHPDGFHFFESDFLVYAAGTLFCLEIKNYRGTIYYADGDQAQIVQEKIGRYGEEIPSKWHRNPLRQAKSFLFHLKRYLVTHADRRFAGLYIVPVAAFVRNKDTDISSIRSDAEGIIYVDELPALFQANCNPKFAARPSRWVIEGLEKVPRPDVMVTMAGDVLRGFFAHTHLVFETSNGERLTLPFSEISEVHLSRSARFSDSDQVLVVLRNGQQMRYVATDGLVRLRTLQGTMTLKHLRNIVSIRPGRPTIPP
jgi:Nuclease-related domain